MMKYLVRFLKIVAATMLFIMAVMTITEVSPIYSFSDPKPFSGELIYNPYQDFNPAYGWKKANFHTHTHASKWFNECEFYPDSIDTLYRSLGYDVVTFSNHMELTDAGLAPVYEHGWNVCKLHNLVFSPEGVNYADCLVPFLTSQQQFKIDRLSRKADFVFQNHPDRIVFMDEQDMSLLTGYRLLEADCGFDDDSTHGRKWDSALSAGHYAPSAISDDLHRPRKTSNVARRCDFLCCPSVSYEDVRKCLLSGCFYSMHLPDYGNGDWTEKKEALSGLPAVSSIGLTDTTTAFMHLTDRAVRIEAIGQGGRVVNCCDDTDFISYRFCPEDTYVRFVARFADGSVIYSNPFARWSGSSDSGTPYENAPHPIDWVLTILFNLIVIGLAALMVIAGIRLLQRRRRTA